ncbi:MAG TPA: rhomboid family intramembrane serine protease [Spirochaetota bacterium]|nr:rhomboid family intramembrane serine protease [Spirochaetota bacterium]
MIEDNKRIGAIEFIIVLNIIMFIPYLIFYVFKIPNIYVLASYFLNLNINNPNKFLSFNDGAYWQIITAMFMHGGIGHIVFNMYGLYLFGKPLELRWGKFRFLAYYMITGVLANLGSALIFIYTGQNISLLGASGAVYAVLLAFGGYFPETRLLLFFFIPLKVKWAILLFTVIELGLQFFNLNTGIAHLTHLLGFLFGFIYLVLIYKLNPIQKMFFPKEEDNYIIR